jgi:hypothetical protein
VASVCEVTHVGETVGQTERRKTLETAEASAVKQVQLNEEERNQKEELKREVTQQSNNPPIDDTEWKSNVGKCLLSVIHYIITRFEPDIDRFEAVEFYRCARIIYPHFISTCTTQDAHNQINKLNNYPIQRKLMKNVRN